MGNVAVQAEALELAETLVHGMERRLVSRLLTYWRTLRDDRPFPLAGDVEPTEIPDLWPRCFILSVDDAMGRAVFKWIGDELAGAGDVALIGRASSDARANSLLGVASVYFEEVLVKGAAVSRGGEMVGDQGETVKYRSILLPLSIGGDRVEEILGAVSWLSEPPGAAPAA